MKLLELFLTFARIGLFTFGGGYGMIPLIQQETLSRGWMDIDALYRFIGISESTPGPIAVNMATFVGASQAGLAGSLCATLGIVLPSFAVILVIAAALNSFRENRLVRSAMTGIKPVVAGMILATGLFAALKCAFTDPVMGGSLALDLRQSGILLLLTLTAALYRRRTKTSLSPIRLLLLSVACGIALYGG